MTWACAMFGDVSEEHVDSIFEGCNAIARVNFTNGFPDNPLTFGSSSPTIYLDGYNGYKVGNADFADLEKRKISEPTVAGKIGQVLMVTANGYEWMDLPNMPVDTFTPTIEIADTFEIPAGWNLLSMPDAELTPSCKRELLKKYQFYTYDNQNKIYVQVDDLQPRTAYWVFATENCTIHFTTLK